LYSFDQTQVTPSPRQAVTLSKTVTPSGSHLVIITEDMRPILDILTHGLIDYAGLFPPAGLSMQHAVAEYAAARAGEYASMLGRFVVPATRLYEFAEAARGMLAVGSQPWRLSTLIGPTIRQDIEVLRGFNQEYSELACVDMLEVKATNVAEVLALRQLLPPGIRTYVEIAANEDVWEMVDALHVAGLRAKIRTGGVTADAFPSRVQLLSFLIACTEQLVPFKATAGLHHVLHGRYRLTYEPDSANSDMFGFLNVLLATAVLQRGPATHLPKALEALAEQDPTTLQLSPGGLRWREECFISTDLEHLRANGMLAFGSCSFREPCEELGKLFLLTTE
jgi:hypothetical protein